MRAFILKCSDIARCPIKSFLPFHYREDGSCLCDACLEDSAVAPFDLMVGEYIEPELYE